MGRSARAAQKWLDGLEGKKLIQIVDVLDGVYRLYIPGPTAIHDPRTLAPDPQHELGFEAEEGNSPTATTIGSADLCAHKGPDVCARKRPPDDADAAALCDWYDQRRKQVAASRPPLPVGPLRAQRSGQQAIASTIQLKNEELELKLPQTSAVARAFLVDPDKRREEMIDHVVARVANLHRSVARALVELVLEGEMDWPDVLAIIEQSANKVVPWQYVVGAAKGAYRQRRRPWPNTHRREQRARPPPEGR